MDTGTENPRSIKALAAAGIAKMRKTVWANQMDHLLIVIVDGRPAVWSYLFCPMNKALSGRDPLPMCAIELDLEAAEWLPYTGPDATSAEYLAERERCTKLMSSSGTLNEESTATEGKIADVYAGRYKPMKDAPKDGTAILALLEGSDIPMPIRWRTANDTMARRGAGWYVTWDNYALQPHDGPRGWLPIPTEWLPETEPIGYISPKQVSAIRDVEGEFGHYHPMRKTRAGLFTLALYADPVTGLYSGMSPLEQRAAQAAPTAQQCACKDRPANQCPGEWEPGCDLGANPAYVRAAQPAQQQLPPAQVENDCEDQGMSNVSEGCNKWPCIKEPLIKAGNGWICTKCGGSY